MSLRLFRIWLAVFLSLGFSAAGASQESFDELLKQGVARGRRGDHAGAIASLQKARQLAPTNYAVNLLLGVSLLRIRRPQDAVIPLRLAGEINSRDGAPEGYLGEAFAVMGDFPQAAQAYQDAIARSPDSEELWTKLADFALERYRVLGLQLRTTQAGMATGLRVEAEGLVTGTEGREDLLQRAALADAEQNGIWGELGLEQLQRGLRDRATATLKMARHQQPENLWTLRLEARMYAADGDWQNAQNALLGLGSRSPEAFRKELRSWPPTLVPDKDVPGETWDCLRQGSTDCVVRIAFPDYRGSDTQEQLFAEQRWERLAALSPPPLKDRAAWFRRGVAEAELGRCALALPALEWGLDFGADRAAFWLELCYASEAEKAADHLASFGDRATVHRLRGDMLVRIKADPKSATSEYEEAIHLRPSEPVLLERLAQAYMNCGEIRQAELASQKALSLDPTRPQALRLLASLAINERDYAKALQFLKKMLAKNPNDAWIRAQAGIAYAQTGSPEQALQYLQPLLTAGYPDERGALHATLAGVLRKLGRDQEAQRAVDEAERLANRFQRGAQNRFDDQQ